MRQQAVCDVVACCIEQEGSFWNPGAFWLLITAHSELGACECRDTASVRAALKKYTEITQKENYI